MPKFTASGTIGNSNLINDASGNLGLGVTPSAWAGRAIQVGAFSGFGTDENGYSFMANNAYNNSGSNYRYSFSSLGSTLYRQSFGSQEWFTAPSGTAGNAITFTQAMTLTAAGNLGLGITTVTADYDRSLIVNGVNPSLIIKTTDNTGYAYLHFKTPSYDWSLGYDAANNFKISNGTHPSTSTKFTITSAGNVGIGTSSPSDLLELKSASANNPNLRLYSTFNAGASAYGINWYRDYDSATNAIAGYIRYNRGGGSDGDMLFGTGTNSAVTERMRITSGGLFKVQNNGSSYESSTAGVNEFNTNANDTNVVFRNTATSLTAARAGADVFFANAAPNNTGSSFYSAADNTGTRTLRFEVRSNGGIANYSANNVSLSDIRTKKDIVPLGSYWNKFKAIEIVKFKYKDQTHDDYNIGVISQQVESVAPEFVDIDGFGTTPEDGIPLKSIYTADLYHATIKVLQEAMVKIEELSAKVTLLENK